MRKHSKSYEQYCWVKQENIVFEETLYHNGTKRVICKNLSDCGRCGGCKNDVLKRFWENDRLFAIAEKIDN